MDFVTIYSFCIHYAKLFLVFGDCKIKWHTRHRSIRHGYHKKALCSTQLRPRRLACQKYPMSITSSTFMKILDHRGWKTSSSTIRDVCHSILHVTLPFSYFTDLSSRFKNFRQHWDIYKLTTTISVFFSKFFFLGKILQFL